jgi:hypothetical protein
MSGEYQLLLMIAVMHLLGLGCVAVLVVFALRQGTNEGSLGESGADDGWGNEPGHPPQPSDRPWGGVPLPDAGQSRLRLRDHRTLSELLPRRQRRPAREPERRPTPAQ